MLDHDKDHQKPYSERDHKDEPRALTEEELAKHPHFRRQTKTYQARKRYVRDLWIYSGLLIMFMPLTAQVISLAALAFISLSVLDGEAGAGEDC